MNKLAILAVGVIGAGAIAASGAGVVSAASTTKATNSNVGSSGIPRDVFKTERQQAEATVLNKSVSDIEAAHKNHTMKTLISGAGLTWKTFHEKVKTQLTSDLKAKGYSQDQITIALQYKQIHHLKHELKDKQKSNS